ncbi:MAG: GNAT family N-acetyltransferase [Lachnospiraceae bacterium]|nr:GNAT family N-acetyltransferase [Lachnospiraceae bacterium]
MNRIKLRTMVDEDINLFKYWLYKPHVAKWYTDPESWLDEFNKRNNEFNWIHHFIAEVDGVAIGFCQYYDCSLSGETWYNVVNVKETYSIDYMIGEEEYLGKRFGTEIILALEEVVKAKTEAKKIIVQPERTNIASRNALLSAKYMFDEVNDIYYKNLI